MVSIELCLLAWREAGYIDAEDTLITALNKLYHTYHLSLSEISDLTRGEASSPTIRKWMIKHDIPLRRRGPMHPPKKKPIVVLFSEEEWQNTSNTELAKMFGLTPNTIRRYARIYNYAHKPPGRRKQEC